MKKKELLAFVKANKKEIANVLEIKKLIGIEVKASSHVDKDDLKGFKAFEEDFSLDKKIIVCNERSSRNIEGEYLAVSLKDFCRKLWAGEFF